MLRRLLQVLGWLRREWRRLGPLDIHLWSQHHPAILVVVAVVLVLVLLGVAWAIRKRSSKRPGPQLAADLAQGNFVAAAERELRAGRLHSAYNLFLRARQPLRAALVAVRMGRLQEAAELFEKAGSRKRAAELYKQVGMQDKVEALMAEEARMIREREVEEADRRERQEEELEADAASLDPPPPILSSPAPATASLGLGDGAPLAPADDLDHVSQPKPAAPSRFGIQALAGEAARKAAPQRDLALAPTQASMATLLAGPAPLAKAVTPAEPVAGREASPAAEELSFGEAKPQLQELSFGEDIPESATSPEASGAAAEPSAGDAPPVEELLLVDSQRHVARPTPPPEAIVENLPEPPRRPARTTPRTPIPVVGPSIGAYRLVRPSEPDVYTPPPSGRPRARTPTPSPRLALGTKQAMGEPTPPPRRTPTPAVSPPPLPTFRPGK